MGYVGAFVATVAKSTMGAHRGVQGFTKPIWAIKWNSFTPRYFKMSLITC